MILCTRNDLPTCIQVCKLTCWLGYLIKKKVYNICYPKVPIDNFFSHVLFQSLKICHVVYILGKEIEYSSFSLPF